MPKRRTRKVLSSSAILAWSDFLAKCILYLLVLGVLEIIISRTKINRKMHEHHDALRPSCSLVSCILIIVCRSCKAVL